MPTFEYSAAIKIVFDLPILSDPHTAAGTEEYRIARDDMGAAISSGDFTGNPKDSAFDYSNTTYWRANSTAVGQFIGRDFGRAVTLTRVMARFDYSSGRPSAYQLQGSSDGTTWYDVATGNFINANGDQSINITATTWRYWRLYFTSRHSSFYSCSELQFFGTRITYSIDGWAVTGYEPSMSPAGAPVQVSYPIRKITKVDDDTALILWLALPSRMKHPQGPISVSFNGSLFGPGNAAVAPFLITFNPGGITPVFNPCEIVYTTINSAMIATAALYAVVRSSYQTLEDIATTLTAAAIMTAALTHINDLEN